MRGLSFPRFCLSLPSPVHVPAQVRRGRARLAPTHNRPQGRAGSLQSLCWGSSSLGSVLSAYFSGSLVGARGPRWVFAATATLPLPVALAGMAIPERPVDAAARRGPAHFRASAAALCANLAKAASNPDIYLPTAFAFAWQVRGKWKQGTGCLLSGGCLPIQGSLGNGGNGGRQRTSMHRSECPIGPAASADAPAFLASSA